MTASQDGSVAGSIETANKMRLARPSLLVVALLPVAAAVAAVTVAAATAAGAPPPAPRYHCMHGYHQCTDV